MHEVEPVYLVSGDDDLLLQRALEDLLARLRAALPELEIERADVASTESLPEMRTASLFGGVRCVVLTGAATLTGTLAQEVADYLDDPAPGGVLVLVARGTGRIRKLAETAGEVGERITVKTPAPWEERAWAELVRSETRRRGHDIASAAVEALLDRAGTQPQSIATKCAQVAAAVPRGARIGVDDVERVVEGHGNRGGFAVADAVADRDPSAAIVALRGALEAGEAPLALLGAITYRMRQLLQARAGASAGEMRTSAGMHRRLSRLARRFAPGELAWCHDRIARTDLDLKGSDLPPELVLEVAVIELATSREPGAPWNPLISPGEPG